MDVRVVTRSAGDAVNLDELKVHCRVRHDRDDALLRTMLRAAVRQFEEYTDTSVLPTVIELQMEGFPCRGPVQLPAPFISLSTVEYLDTNNVLQTLSGLTTRTGSIFTQLNPPENGWPEVSCRGYGDEVKITLTCGYSEVPEDVKVSFMTLVLNWYENREVGDVPDGILNLWWPYQVEPLADAE